MKQLIWTGFAVVILGATIWGGWVVWRARTDRVSLNVRNAPLAEVLASLSRQSREMIVADQSLDTRITLQFKNLPLMEALQRVGRQAGALAGKVHAIYRSSRSLSQLKQALSGGKDLESVEWRTIAPNLEMPLNPPGGEKVQIPFGGASPANPLKVVTEDVMVGPGGPGPDAPAEGANGSVRIGKLRKGETPMVVMRFGRADGEGNMQMEVWTPERIAAPTELAAKLSNVDEGSASRSSAVELAKQVKSNCQTFFVLKAAPATVDTLMTGGPQHHIETEDGAGRSAPRRPPENVEAMVQREKLSQYQGLTPEQRVRRARQMQGMEKANQLQH